MTPRLAFVPPHRFTVDMAGRRQGFLRVVSRAPNTPRAAAAWHVQCLRCRGPVYQVRGAKLRVGTSACAQCCHTVRETNRRRAKDDVFQSLFDMGYSVHAMAQWSGARPSWIIRHIRPMTT